MVPYHNRHSHHRGRDCGEGHAPVHRQPKGRTSPEQRRLQTTSALEILPVEKGGKVSKSGNLGILYGLRQGWHPPKWRPLRVGPKGTSARFASHWDGERVRRY